MSQTIDELDYLYLMGVGVMFVMPFIVTIIGWIL